MIKTALFLILLSFTALAGPYLAGSMGQITQDDVSSSDINNDLLIQGNGLTFYLGYQVSFIAVEGFYKTVSGKANDDERSFKYNNTMRGLAARIYLLSFINFKFGTMIHDGNGTITSDSNPDVSFESTETTSFTGAGIKFNIGKLDIFADVNSFSHEDDQRDDFSLSFQEIELGARYNF